MLLSIITINYNNAEGLRKTLASVAAQTYPYIQHIIVDGGSTDGSVEIIREYADNQCKVESVKCKGTENSKPEPLASTPSGVPDKVRDFVGCSYTLHQKNHTKVRFFLHDCKFFTTFATQTKSLQTYFIKSVCFI